MSFSEFDRLVIHVTEDMRAEGRRAPSDASGVDLVRRTLEAVVARAQKGNRVRTPIGTFYLAHHAPKRVIAFGNPGAETKIEARQVVKFTAASHLRGVKR